MKKILLLALLTLGLGSITPFSSFSQDLPPEPPPPSTGPTVTVNISNDIFYGELIFNRLTGECTNSDLRFHSGGRVIKKSIVGVLCLVYRGVMDNDGEYPWGKQWYFHYEGVLTYRYTSTGPDYTINIDGSHGSSIPYD